MRVSEGPVDQLEKKKYLFSVTWIAIWAKKISLSLSNSPRLVYMKIMKVMLSTRFLTLSWMSTDGSADTIAFWKTMLNACFQKGGKKLNANHLQNLALIAIAFINFFRKFAKVIEKFQERGGAYETILKHNTIRSCLKCDTTYLRLQRSRFPVNPAIFYFFFGKLVNEIS